MKKPSRREFFTSSAAGVVGASMVSGFPTIVPSTVFGATSPSNRINVGAIGTGRISRGHDMPGIWKHDSARIMAVCDLDRNRVEDAKVLVNGQYAKQTGKPYDGVTTYTSYRELLANKDVDAVVISTPDHWHAEIACAAANAGKAVYLQKPFTMTHEEGVILRDTVARTRCVLQVGSQQRSWEQFRRACELVRSGRVGRVRRVEIGLPIDPTKPDDPAQPVPENLNYERWLGPTVEAALEELAAAGQRHVLVAPIGFLCDHVETLYDIDIELKQLAAARGMHLERVAMLNDSSAFIDTLADIVMAHESSLSIAS